MPLAAGPRRASRAGTALGVVLLHLALAARADGRQPPLRLDQAAGLPFERDELAEAVALRAPLTAESAGAVTVAITSGGPGRVAIGSGGRRVEAEVGNRTGREAARLVALLVIDVSRSAPAEEEAAEVAPARLSLFLAPSLNFGLSDAGVSLEPALGLQWRLAGPLGLVLSLGYARAQAVDRGGARVMTFDSVPIRAGLVRALGPFGLQAGLLVRGFRASAAVSTLGARQGGWAAATWSLPLKGTLRPFAIVALDAYTERLRLDRAGRPVLSAGYLAPWAGLGLAWTGQGRR
jgi:hypothetical protein